MPQIADRLASALEGRYRIDRELGVGGMATVYLADDLRHGRRVAIKLLHPELSAVLGLERFLAEIKLTAGLQHPHILPLFDSGSADGLLYYVMPYVEGETLRRRLQRDRQLPVAEAIRLATEVADALEYAHGRGVVHRDIKPENILLQGDHAEVSDFGIALAVEQAGGSRLTQTGLSLGTPQYMAPEQATGEKTVDQRADVYALGAVTYEMLAGEPPFTGPTAQAIVAKVITERPRPLRELRETVPPHVAAAVQAALQKLPADRPATAAAFGRLLHDLERTREIPAAAPVRSWPRQAAFIAAGLFGLAVATGVGYTLGRHSGIAEVRVAPPSRLAILAPSLGGGGGSALHRQIALTPDGSGLVFVVSRADGGNAMAYQRLDAGTAVPIQGSDNMADPLVSLDGRWLVAFGDTTRMGVGASSYQGFRLPTRGGNPSALPSNVDTRFAAWASDGALWFTPTSNQQLHRLAPDGRITLRFPDRRGLRLQQVLAGDRLALVVHAAIGTASGPLFAFDLRTGAETPVVEIPVVEARYVAAHLIYVGPDGVLWAVPMDAAHARLVGAPVQIATGLSLTGTGQAQFTASPNGTVAYIPEEPRSLVLADRTGVLRLATADRRSYHAPKFSPDGRRLSVDFTTGDGRDVWILSLAQGTLSRATFDRDGHDATWTPDGRSLTYTSFKSGVLGIYRVRPGVDTPAESLLASASLGYTGQWLRDGSRLITVGQGLRPGSGADIAVVLNGGHGPMEPLIANPLQTEYPAVSPDGRWLAYVSDQSGGQQVFVRPLASTGEEVQVSQRGGNEPVWGPNGRELFYRGTNGSRIDLMVAELRTAQELEVVSRRTLFSLEEIVGTAPHANYDVSPDGKTFAMVRRSPATRIVVLQNLSELVRNLSEANPATQ